MKSLSFNTQPPEGGWIRHNQSQFQLTVSTHSRLKAAGRLPEDKGYRLISFNTQPPEGGWRAFKDNVYYSDVSTHSRLKAAGARPN